MFSFTNVVFMVSTGVVALVMSLAVFCPEVLKNFFKKEKTTPLHFFLQMLFVLIYVLGLFGILITIWNAHLNI